MKDKEKKILIILIISLIVIDQALKIILLLSHAKIGNIIGIIENTKSEGNGQYILISIIAILALIRYIMRNNTFIKMDSRIILSFAIAGAVSNTIDRIWNGGTLNYIKIPKFTALNLSYVYIIVAWVGMAIILTKYTIQRIKEKKVKNENNSKRK